MGSIASRNEQTRIWARVGYGALWRRPSRPSADPTGNPVRTMRLRRLVLRHRSGVWVNIWVVLGIATLACRRPAPRELTRVTSRDGRVDAVVVERLPDATVSTPFEVYIVPRGRVPNDDTLILRIDKSSAPQLEWMRDNELAVRCRGARIWQFTNFATVRMSDDSF